MTNDDIINDVSLHSIEEKKTVTKGRLSQFMILINGFILSVAAFVTLMIFMDQMNDSKIKNLNNVILKNISAELSGVTNAFVLSPSYELISDDNGFIKNNVLSDFNGLYHFKNDNDQWSAHIIANQNNLNDNEISETLNTIVKQSIPDGNGVHLLLVEATNNIWAIMRDGVGGYYAGSVHQDVFATVLDDNASIYRVRVFGDVDGLKLLTMTNTNAVEPSNYNDLSQILGKIVVNDRTYSITTEIARDSFYIFVSKLPYLLLLFGGTLTVVGALYVRNNQKQGNQLEKMNLELEDKNQILEDKINESQILYERIVDKDQEYQSVLNAVQDILFEVDKSGQIQFVNAAWTDMTNMDAEEVLYRDLFSFFGEDESMRLRKGFASFVDHQTAVAEEALIKLPNGSYRAVEIVFSVIRENREGQMRIIGTIHDAEEKQRAKQALSEVEKKYKTIVENAAGGIYQITPKGQVMSGNPALAHILGYDDVDELVADDFNMNAAFISTKDRRDYEIALSRNGVIRNFETELRQSNGEMIWVNENARCVRDIDGTILYYEGSIEDITQRKIAETDLIQEKLNSDLASRAKSEFLANMSHELRTPLNAIIGFSEIIKGEALGAIDNKNYVDYARDIYDSGGRLLNVINEILGISKIDAGDRQLSESIVNIGGVVDTCCNLLASKIESHSLDVSNMIDENTPSIVVEELAFKQIFMNLLSNAIKFTPANGKITIMSEYNEGGDLRLSITDTGVGMDESEIPKALSPFGQLNNSLSRSNMGTGLGLTLVSSLVHLHEGELEMISQKGIGTTITITIPSKRVAVKKQKESQTGRGGNVSSLRDYKAK